LRFMRDPPVTCLRYMASGPQGRRQPESSPDTTSNQTEVGHVLRPC
jgi:hypothetical protein